MKVDIVILACVLFDSFASKLYLDNGEIGGVDFEEPQDKSRPYRILPQYVWIGFLQKYCLMAQEQLGLDDRGRNIAAYPPYDYVPMLKDWNEEMTELMDKVYYFSEEIDYKLVADRACETPRWDRAFPTPWEYAWECKMQFAKEWCAQEGYEWYQKENYGWTDPE